MRCAILDLGRRGRVRARHRPVGFGKTTFLNIAACSRSSPAANTGSDNVDVRGMDDDERSRLAQREARLHLPELQPDSGSQLSTTSPCLLRYRGFALPSASTASRKR